MLAALNAWAASNPITRGTLMRHLMREEIAANGAAAATVLKAFMAHPSHRFWPDSRDYVSINWRGVLGHRQVTDAYLAGLAREQKGRRRRANGMRKPEVIVARALSGAWCLQTRADHQDDSR